LEAIGLNLPAGSPSSKKQYKVLVQSVRLKPRNATDGNFMLGRENQYRVLLVDDDPKILNFARLKLKVSGFEVITAMTGHGALTMIESQKPDIIVLDLKMPGMGGLEVIRIIRTSSNLPVIVVSAATDLEKEALDLGANAFMSKPFDPDELVRRIQAILDMEEESSLL
jgi:DNA-binding response OmpR family regulator